MLSSNRTNLAWILVPIVLLFLLLISFRDSAARLWDSAPARLRDSSSSPFWASNAPRTPKETDGCRYVYLDLGTNLGVQIRKVYEPELYFNSSILRHFEKYFPRETRPEVCSIGFEPNPNHGKRLDELEDRYAAMGWRAKIKRLALSNRDSEAGVEFWADPQDGGREWGARLGGPVPVNQNKKVAEEIKKGNKKAQKAWEKKVEANKKAKVTVPLLDFVTWFEREVVGREIPPGEYPPRIVMKMDIEGEDPKVFRPMLYKGLFCLVNFIYFEAAHLSPAGGVAYLKKVVEDVFDEPPVEHYKCNPEMVNLDDESFGKDGKPWPEPVELTKEVKEAVEKFRSTGRTKFAAAIEEGSD